RRSAETRLARPRPPLSASSGACRSCPLNDDADDRSPERAPSDVEHGELHRRCGGCAMSTPLVELDKVARVYGCGESEVRALHDTSLRIDAGEFVAVMGPSGSGKSTCMNIVGGLDRPTSGAYRFAGVDVTGFDARSLAL